MCINTIRTHHIELGTQATISMNNTHTHTPDRHIIQPSDGFKINKLMKNCSLWKFFVTKVEKKTFQARIQFWSGHTSSRYCLRLAHCRLLSCEIVPTSQLSPPLLSPFNFSIHTEQKLYLKRIRFIGFSLLMPMKPSLLVMSPLSTVFFF